MNALATATPTTTSVEQYRLVTIQLHDSVIADRGRAAMLRDRFLEPLSTSPVPVIVDLNQIQVLTMSAADELVARWLERARSPRHALIAVFATYSEDIRDTLHAVLRDARQVAYRVRSLPGPAERPRGRDILGDLSPAHQRTLDYLMDLTNGSATASEAAQGLGLTATAATNRLTDLAIRGLLFRLPQPGRGGDVFAYPWPQSEKALKQLYRCIAAGDLGAGSGNIHSNGHRPAAKQA